MKLFKVLGFMFTWFAPFIVVYINHVSNVEGGFEVDMFGMLFIALIVILLIRYIDKRVDVWDIQNRHKVFILNWKSLKKIAMTAMFAGVFYLIEDDIPKIQWTLVLVTGCFTIGWVLALLGSINKKKATD